MEFSVTFTLQQSVELKSEIYSHYEARLNVEICEHEEDKKKHHDDKTAVIISVNTCLNINFSMYYGTP